MDCSGVRLKFKLCSSDFIDRMLMVHYNVCIIVLKDYANICIEKVVSIWRNRLF